MNQAQTEAPLKRTFRGSRDALIQKASEEPDLSWRVLITLNAFRLLACGVLLGLLVFAPFLIGVVTAFTIGFGGAAGLLLVALIAARMDMTPRAAPVSR
jgi:uncharacterized transporter YbjL